MCLTFPTIQSHQAFLDALSCVFHRLQQYIYPQPNFIKKEAYLSMHDQIKVHEWLFMLSGEVVWPCNIQRNLNNTANHKLWSASATEIDNKAENTVNKYLVTLWQASHEFHSQAKTNDCCHATMFNCWGECHPE